MEYHIAFKMTGLYKIARYKMQYWVKKQDANNIYCGVIVV